MLPSQARQFNAEHHTFLTKRFDRNGKQRIHFSSAMTQLKSFDGEHLEGASYLKIAEFISHKGAQTKTDLEQLWRRIVFNIAVSNTEDHLPMTLTRASVNRAHTQTLPNQKMSSITSWPLMLLDFSD
jgi:serine/threonine-protein kinase HipA